MIDLRTYYDDFTEVLTSEGFIPWRDVTYNTKIATVDSWSHRFVGFELPRYVQHKSVNNVYMLNFGSPHLSLQVSPTSTLFCSISNTRVKINHPEFELISADIDLYCVYKNTWTLVCNRPMRMLKCADNGSSQDTSTDDILYALYGFFIGDGHALKEYGGNTIRFGLTKLRKREYLQAICKKCGMVVDLYGPKNMVVRSEGIGHKFRDMFYNEQKKKTFPTHFFNMTTNQYNYFTEGLLNSDGSVINKTWRYDTASVELMNRLQALASINGDATTITEKDVINPHNPSGPLTHIYAIMFMSGRHMPHINSCKADGKCTRILYTGKVHSATVSTGLTIVRRNKMVALCGSGIA